MFKLDKEFIGNFQNVEPEWPSGISKVTFYRTYARLKADGSKEKFWEVILRCVEGSFTFLLNQAGSAEKLDRILEESYGEDAQTLAQSMYSAMFEMKFLPPGRGLWMMGTEKAYGGAGIALQNCAFVSTESCLPNPEDGLTPFGFLMDVSMLGTGCGFDTEGEGTKVYLPSTTEKYTYVIEDSREGWVSSLDQLICSYLDGKNQPTVEFDYSEVRPYGLPIRGFGGVASGPEPLRKLHEQVREFLARDAYETGSLTSRTIVDIMNCIGACVVAGNVRRSSLIALGEAEDEDFVTIKDYSLEKNQYRQTIGSYSNNSVKVRNFEISKDQVSNLVDILVSGGDPGYVYIDQIKAYGRINHDDVDKGKYNLDAFAIGTNPCGEQSLHDRELCNLVETFPSRCYSLFEFQEVCELAYLYAKSVTMAPVHNPVTQRIIESNRRLGISISGIVLAIEKFGYQEFFNTLDFTYKILHKQDGRVSAYFGITPSIKLTTVKPSGTVSLVAGVTSGIHYPMGQYYLKRMRIATNDPLVQWAKDSGYHVEGAIVFEEDKHGNWVQARSETTSIIEFPVKYPYTVTPRDRVPVSKQHNLIAQIQKYWSDNQVSATVTYHEHEIDEIKDFVYYASRNPIVKSISYLKNDCNDYPQMPESKLTEERYEAIMGKIKDIPIESYLAGQREKGESGCTNDTCTI